MRLYRTAEGWWAERDGKYAKLADFDIDAWLAGADPIDAAEQQAESAKLQRGDVPSPKLPLGSQEVWAAGVTYLRSKAARMEESSFGATAYDRVYESQRPEIFFKATPRRCVGAGETLRLRADSKWIVPEPELALVIAASCRLVGFTIGDDLSCRDIEGENLLYLPQAKVWDGCCALGPCILVNEGSVDLRRSAISLEIQRDGRVAFSGTTPIGRMKRSFEELTEHLFREQSFPTGVVLLTGTGIVPPDDFTLRSGDEIAMCIAEIGILRNGVR